jgi:hypothetical protein
MERVGAGATGVLEVTHDGDRRAVSLVRGMPVAVVSTLEGEDLATTLVTSGRVESARMEWMRKHCGPDESLVEGLLAAGSLSESSLDDHLREHLFGLVGASLRWTGGEWSWMDGGEDAARRFDPVLLQSVDALEAMVHGVLQSFERGALRTFTQDTDAGTFVADPRLTGEVPPAWLPEELRLLPERLATGADALSLAESLAMDPDRIAAILWLLEATGLVHRRNPPAALVPVGSVATIVPAGKMRPRKAKKKSTKPARRSKARKEQVEAAPAAEAVAPAKVETPSTPEPEAAAPAQPDPPQPAPRTKTVRPRSKKRTPAPPKKKGPKPTIHRAQELLAAEDYEAAYIMLHELRNAHPSCPDTLAALGWAGWRTGNHGTNAYDSPTDFLLLALTFDPAHTKALEYFARMAMDQGDVEAARNRLLQLLQVDPGANWARSALEEGDLSTKRRKGGLGLRFWPKGKA